MKRESVKRKPCEYENGEIVFKRNNLILKIFRYQPEARKLVIVCMDVYPKYKEFQLSDYGREYGDVMGMYIPKRNRRLEITSKTLSNIINNDSLFEKYVSILLIGVGAAGLCIVDMLKYLRINKNIMISTIATPFYGTIMADEELAKGNISFFDIPSKIDYYNISRKYHLRRPELRVGSKFLKGMDYSLLEKCKFINFVAQEIEPSRLSKEVFGPISNDGISTTVSQEVNLPGAKMFPIRTSHQDSLFKALEYFRG